MAIADDSEFVPTENREGFCGLSGKPEFGEAERSPHPTSDPVGLPDEQVKS